MEQNEISKATLGRIPTYLKYLNELPKDVLNISATTIARELGLGEVQVRKDLGSISSTGKPRVGYLTSELTACLENILKARDGRTVIVGAGKLGKALLDYGGFEEYGISMLAAFDIRFSQPIRNREGKLLLPMEALPAFCRENDVKIGVIAVPPEAAQDVFNQLYENGIKAVWCFAPCRLYKPEDAVIQYENMALSLAHLKMQLK